MRLYLSFEKERIRRKIDLKMFEIRKNELKVYVGKLVYVFDTSGKFEIQAGSGGMFSALLLRALRFILTILCGGQLIGRSIRNGHRFR